MTSFPIIDTHVHLWDPRRLRYPWMGGNDVLDRPYGIEDYQRDSQGIETEAMVFVECDAESPRSLEESSSWNIRAQRDARILAIVASASRTWQDCRAVAGGNGDAFFKAPWRVPHPSIRGRSGCDDA